MNPQPVPSVAKALVAMRIVLDLLPKATPLMLHCALFEADVEHVDTYGRQIYGERWTIDWSGPRGRIIDGMLGRDPVTLAQIDPSERRVFDEIGYCHHGTSLDLQPVLPRVRTISARRGLSETPTDLLSESDLESLRGVCAGIPPDDRDTLDRLIRHPATMRSRGIVVEPRDMLDPSDPGHAERVRALAETSASTYY